MKTATLVTLLAGTVATGAFAQGTIAVDNEDFTSTSPTAQSGGIFFSDTASLVPYTGARLNIEVFGGPGAGSLSPIVTLSGPNAMVYTGTPGVYADPTGNTYLVPGVPSQGTAVLELEVWTGSDLTFNAALTDGSIFNEVIFQNPTGGPGIPPEPPQDLVGMPAVLMPGPGPEPSTIALGGVGAAVLMLLRRRK